MMSKSRYVVTIECEESPNYDDGVARLVISVDGVENCHYDHGEPEDNTFFRDWSWVEEELKRAYELGRQHASEEIHLKNPLLYYLESGILHS